MIAHLVRPGQDHPGKLSFATDAWTSPNHRAFVAITVHLEHNGHSLRMLLDIVEVAEVRTELPRPWQQSDVHTQSHTGVNLANAFIGVLKEFGIEEKVSQTLS